MDNDVDAANKTVTVSATATGGNGVANPADATLTVTDDDTRGVTVTGVSLTMDEADKAGTQDTREDQDSYTVVLDSEPTDDVRINITAPDMVTLSPTSLTFTPANWNVAQTVTATAVNDAIDNAGNERTGNITHAVVEGDSDYAGVAAESVAVTVNDDDGTPVVTLKLTPATIAESGDGNSTTVTATLSGASSQAVTLTVAASAVSPAAAGDFTLSGTTLTIAAGATESTGTVTITAVDNDVDAANKTVTVSATATGGNGVANPADATLTITDDDTRGVTVTGGTLTMDEADKAGTQDTREDQASYTVVLDSEPTDDVRIDITAPDMVTLSPTSLTFTPANWNVAQTVTATAVNDAIDNAGNERTGNITHAVVEGDSDYAGVAAERVAVTVNDDDGTPVVTLELDPASIAESGDGNSTTVTASLSGASSQAITLTVAASAVSPAAAGDFTLSGTTLTIAAGATESTGTVTITAVANERCRRGQQDRHRLGHRDRRQRHREPGRCDADDHR